MDTHIFNKEESIFDLIENNKEKFSYMCELTPHLSHVIDSFVVHDYLVSLLDIHWFTNVPRKKLWETHDFVEIQIPYTGRFCLHSREKFKFCSRGQFSITPPNKEHHWELTESPIAVLILWLQVNTRKNHIDSESVNENIKNMLAPAQLTYDLPPLFFDIFDNMLFELSSKRPYSDQILNKLFQVIILQIAHSISSQKEHHFNIYHMKIKNMTGRMFLSRVDEFIQNNLSQIEMIDDIAMHFDISTRTLNRRYTKAKGKSLWKVVNDMRIAQARELLINSYLTIKEISTRCGFLDSRYFSNKFKQQYGMPPSTYRKDHM